MDQDPTMKKIIDLAQADPRIRMVTLEGSRVNHKIPRDAYQDYDVTFIVEEMKSFLEDETWLRAFGDIAMMQKPEAMSLFPPTMKGFSYLMYFKDGLKLDLSLWSVADLEEYLSQDPLILVLMDKDDRLAEPQIPSDQEFWIKKPSQAIYSDSCNEFWFVVPYVAKGLLRGEILFANHHMTILHRELLRMISWQLGFRNGFDFSLGKYQKFLDRYLPEATFAQVLETYNLSSYENCWKSLVQAMELFRQAGREVAQQLNCEYPGYDAAITAYLDVIKAWK